MAKEMDAPFLARIPIDPELVIAEDEGKAFAQDHSESPAARAFDDIVRGVLRDAPVSAHGRASASSEPSTEAQADQTRIAMPLAEGRVAAHFGHCEEFAFIDVGPDGKALGNGTRVPAPEHQPGLLPPWLREQGVDLVIAGGMGQHAQHLFEQASVNVVVGAPSDEPESVVQAYLDGELETSENACDH